jgi:hypothetical protein
MLPSLASFSVRQLLLYAAVCSTGLGLAQPVFAQELLPNGLPVAEKTLELPEVELPERQAVREIGESPFYYRIPDNTVAGWSRSAVGLQVTLPTNEEQDAFARATEGARFSFDLLGGVELSFARDEPYSVVAELGYSYVYERSHWFVVGLGPGLHGLGPTSEAEDPRPSGDFGVALVPHAVVGSLDGHFAYGLRSSLLARWHAFGIELGHQVAYVEELDRTVHELHLMISPTYSGVIR